MKFPLEPFPEGLNPHWINLLVGPSDAPGRMEKPQNSPIPQPANPAAAEHGGKFLPCCRNLRRRGVQNRRRPRIPIAPVAPVEVRQVDRIQRADTAARTRAVRLRLIRQAHHLCDLGREGGSSAHENPAASPGRPSRRTVSEKIAAAK